MAETVAGATQLKARLRAVGSPAVARAILGRWQMRAIQLAKVHAPKRSGNLKRSIIAGTLTDASASIEAGADYAAFVEYGTRPHIIRPVHGRSLAWSSDPGAYTLIGTMRAGRRPDIFAKVVHHPGTSPRPYLYPAAQQALEEVNADPLVAAWNDAA